MPRSQFPDDLRQTLRSTLQEVRKGIEYTLWPRNTVKLDQFRSLRRFVVGRENKSNLASDVVPLSKQSYVWSAFDFITIMIPKCVTLEYILLSAFVVDTPKSAKFKPACTIVQDSITYANARDPPLPQQTLIFVRRMILSKRGYTFFSCVTVYPRNLGGSGEHTPR